jgi:alkanesulfonate monooxygenase SsuD/methylene tetrahydromethanopterin reductase-like flavin-dependent oxidoreductase (luciferase family)
VTTEPCGAARHERVALLSGRPTRRSEHFKQARGYQLYGDSVDLLRAIGLEALAAQYVEVQAYGTPEAIAAKLRHRREIIGDFRFNACFRFGGIAYEAAERSMRLFAERVMPAQR